MRFARLIATGTATCSIIGSSLGVGVIFAGFFKSFFKNSLEKKIKTFKLVFNNNSKLFNKFLNLILNITSQAASVEKSNVSYETLGLVTGLALIAGYAYYSAKSCTVTDTASAQYGLKSLLSKEEVTTGFKTPEQTLNYLSCKKDAAKFIAESKDILTNKACRLDFNPRQE